MEGCYRQTCEQAVTGKKFIHKCLPTDRKGTDRQEDGTDGQTEQMDRHDRWTERTDGLKGQMDRQDRWTDMTEVKT